MKNTSLVVLCAFLAICSCRKKGTENTDVSFNNRLNKPVTLTVYPTMDDYAKGTNVVVRKTINGSDIVNIPTATLKPGKTYYMDWYTDDYVNSNWYNDKFPQPEAQVAFTPNVGSSAYYISTTLSSAARKTYLSDNDLTSTWRAVNAYLYSGTTGYASFWSKLSENDQYREVVVHKDFKAEYKYKDGAGNVFTLPMEFKVHRSAEAYIEFIKDDGMTIQGSLATGKLPTGKAPDYTSTSKDTVMAMLPNSDYYFMMIRN